MAITQQAVPGLENRRQLFTSTLYTTVGLASLVVLVEMQGLLFHTLISSHLYAVSVICHRRVYREGEEESSSVLKAYNNSLQLFNNRKEERGRRD